MFLQLSCVQSCKESLSAFVRVHVDDSLQPGGRGVVLQTAAGCRLRGENKLNYRASKTVFSRSYS